MIIWMFSHPKVHFPSPEKAINRKLEECFSCFNSLAKATPNAAGPESIGQICSICDCAQKCFSKGNHRFWKNHSVKARKLLWPPHSPKSGRNGLPIQIDRIVILSKIYISADYIQQGRRKLTRDEQHKISLPVHSFRYIRFQYICLLMAEIGWFRNL